MTTTDDRHPWEYHEEWETPLWFERFREYYLKQSRPRRKLDAYRAYYATEDKGTVEESQALVSAPKSWGFASLGKHPKTGKPIPGALTWEERAAAYDSHLDRALDELLIERRRRATERALGRLDRLWKKWDEQESLFNTLKTERVETIPVTLRGEDGEEIRSERQVRVMAVNLGDLRALVKLHNDLTIQERRALGLAERVFQQNVADNKGDKLETGVSALADLMAEQFRAMQELRRQQYSQEKKPDAE